MPDQSAQFFDEHHRRFFEWLQKALVSQIQGKRSKLNTVSTVVGVDVAYSNDISVAAAVSWDVDERRVVEVSRVRSMALFPYSAGFLFLREAPVMVAAVRGIVERFDVVLVDGHGIAHPREAGLAVFVGAALGMPSLGVAKSLLVGDLGVVDRGMQEITLDGSLVGYGVKPKDSRRYFASPGFGLDVEDVAYLLGVLGGRYPEALRQAHIEARRGLKEVG
ncbi:MAG: endonuclease V [Thaumarchaeota archaeon]|nr:endonuclease V [Nitrososphaerota archaeon]